MKFKCLIYSTILLLLITASSAFSQEHTINIEDIIKNRESQNQALERISDALNKVTGKAENFLQNHEELDIVKDYDRSDEMNLENLISFIFQEKINGKLGKIFEEFGAFLALNANKTKLDNNSFGLSVNFLLVSLSLFCAVLVSSVAVIKGKEATKFSMIEKESLPNLVEIDKKANIVAEKRVIHYTNTKNVNVEKSKVINPEYSMEAMYNYNQQEWAILGQEAIKRLEEYASDSEFKGIYNYYRKKNILSGRALEDSINGADNAIQFISDDTTEGALVYLIKSRHAAKYGGDQNNNSNPASISLDLAYLSAVSPKESEDPNNDFWASNTWN